MTNFTAAVGRKWNPDGEARRFPGNTVLTMLSVDTDLHRVAARVSREARRQPFAHRFAFLPPDSYHMTVFDLLNDHDRGRDHWSRLLSDDASMTEADRAMCEACRRVPPPTDLAMQLDGVEAGENLSLTLVPAGTEIACRLSRYREALSEATGVRRPDHDGYRFHVSLAYRLTMLSGAEEEVCRRFADAVVDEDVGVIVNLDPPALHLFDDMTAYVPWSRRHELTTRVHEI